MKLAYTVATPDTADAAMLAVRGDLEANFRLLAGLGYAGAELMVRDPARLNAAAIARAAGDLGLAVPAVSTGQLRKEDGLSLAAPEEKARAAAIDRTRSVIDFAARFGAQVNIGTLRGHLGKSAAAREAATDSLHALLEYARSAGVGLAIEPQCRFVIDWLNSVAETLCYLERFGGARPSLLFDVYHAMLEERSVAAAAVRARSAISWVQVSDSNRMAPGAGQLAIADALRVLRALGYEGFVSVECLQRPDSETAARQAARYLAPLLDEEF